MGVLKSIKAILLTLLIVGGGAWFLFILPFLLTILLVIGVGVIVYILVLSALTESEEDKES
jgi:zinc transporter ZupT